jgi:hypothetical protein
LSQPYSDLKDCEKQIAEVEANILNSIKQINTYLDIKPKISNSLIKETVERRIAVFQEAKDFYIALYDYWKFNNVKKLLFHIKKIKHNALNYEQDLLASDVVGCKKMEVIQKIGNDLNLRTRFGTDYEDFIKVKDIFVKQNYIYIIDRSGRD